MNNEQYAFSILTLLNSSQNYIIKQNLITTTPKLEEVKEESVFKQFSDVQLLGMYYTIKISQDNEEQFLIFATPLEHLLSTNIILQNNSSLYRIEYEYKICLILPQHIDYLQKPYTFLEEIESPYLENYQYTPTFEQKITLLLPKSKYFLNKIILCEENSNNDKNNKFSLSTHYKPLLTPHINTLHANFCIENNIFVFNITSSKQFLEYIYKYSYFTPNSTTKHFFGGQIINFISTRYSIEIIPSLANIALNSYTTTFYFKVSPNTHLPLITTQKSNYPLPIYISRANEYTHFTSLESFKELTGVHFKYDYDLLQKLMIKENYAHNSQLCHFFIPQNTAYLLFEKSPLQSYTSPTQYFLKSFFFKPSFLDSQSSHLRNLKFNQNNLFTYNYTHMVNELLQLTKKAIIANTHYPDASKQSILSHYCIYLFKELNSIKEQISSLLELTIDNSQNTQEEVIKMFNSKYYYYHEKIYSHMQQLSHILLYTNISEDEIFEINLILQTLYEVIQLELNNSSTNVEEYLFNFSKIDFSFFIDLDLFDFSNNNSNYEQLSKSEKVLYNYNENEINTHYLTISSLSTMLSYLTHNSFKFATNNSSLKKILSLINPKSEQIESFNLNHTSNTLSKNSHKTIFSNNIVELYFK